MCVCVCSCRVQDGSTPIKVVNLVTACWCPNSLQGFKPGVTSTFLSDRNATPKYAMIKALPKISAQGELDSCSNMCLNCRTIASTIQNSVISHRSKQLMLRYVKNDTHHSKSRDLGGQYPPGGPLLRYGNLSDAIAAIPFMGDQRSFNGASPLGAVCCWVTKLGRHSLQLVVT